MRVGLDVSPLHLTRAGTARVIEMNVGEHDVIDGRRRNILRPQRGHHVRHRTVDARVDDGGPAAFDDQMNRVELRPHVMRVDRTDAVIVIDDVAHLRIVHCCNRRVILDA